MKICEEPRFAEVFKNDQKIFSQVGWKLSK